MARSDADRVAQAQLYGAATGLRDAIRLNHDPGLEPRTAPSGPSCGSESTQWSRRSRTRL